MANDNILKIDNKPLINGRMGMTQVASLQPGQVIDIEVSRNNRPLQLQLTVGKRPAEEQ
jgi:S1-C subfamily serine protease